MFYNKTYKNLHPQHSYESKVLKFILKNVHSNKNLHMDNLLLNVENENKIFSYN